MTRGSSTSDRSGREDVDIGGVLDEKAWESGNNYIGV